MGGRHRVQRAVVSTHNLGVPQDRPEALATYLMIVLGVGLVLGHFLGLMLR